MARNAKQIIEIEAKDSASDALEEVAKKAEALDKLDPEVKVDADDNASSDLKGIEDKAKRLDKGTTDVKVDADDKASDELADIRGKLERLDKDEAEVLLKAEAKDARADLRAAQRELIALDGEEGEVEVKAEISEAKSRLEAIDREMKALDGEVAEPKIEARDAEPAGSKAGGLFSVGAIKAIAGSAIATAIASVFNAGMDKIQLAAKFTSEFGLVKSESRRLVKEAGDIYSNGWGESVDQVTGSIGLVNQALVQTGRVSKDETSKITTDALAISAVYGEDVSKVIRATSLLLSNGLATSATEATDLIVKGLQDGGNQAGDFFETIDEYSQHFGAMGLSGADMMSIITHGLQNGQRDADKLADAVKEMRLRTTDAAPAISEAYRAIGLDADEYRTKVLAGGDTAKGAYIDILNALDSVKDPTEKNALAVQLIGTQYEDLGPKAIESLKAIADETDNATGATELLVAEQDEATSELGVAFRETKQDIADLGGAIAETGNSWAGAYNKGAAPAKAWQRDLIGITELTGSFKAAVEQTSGPLENFEIRAAGAATKIGALAVANDTAATATAANEVRVDAQKVALDGLTGSLTNAYNAQLAMVDPIFASMQATENYDAAMVAMNEEGGNTIENQAAVVTAHQGVQASLLRVAEESNLTGDQMIQMGIDAGLSAEQARVLAGAVDNTTASAEAFAGPYEANLKAENRAALRDIAIPQGSADGFGSGTYNASITASDHASGTINAVRNNLNALNGTNANVSITTHRRNGGGRDPRLAKGSGGAQGGPALVGEQGAEIVNLNRGDTVATAEKTKKVMAGSRGGTTNIVNNWPAGVNAEDVVRAQRRYMRRNGVTS